MNTVIIIDNGQEKITWQCTQQDADRATMLLDRAIGQGTRQTS